MKTRPEIMTLSEVAEYLKISIRTVRRRIKYGKLGAFKEGGNLRVLSSELDRYIEAQIGRVRTV